MKKDYIENLDKKAERRFYSPHIEIRAEGEEGIIEGIAAVVEKKTDMGWYEEKIARGAFDDVLKDDVAALFNHDPNYPLARSVDGKGTLSLFITDNGDLGYRYKTPNRSFAKDLEDAIRSGDISKSSFAFVVAEEDWQWAEEGSNEMDQRTIKKFARLYDVSPVTYPAYQDTAVAARSAESFKPKKPDLGRYKMKLIKHKYQ